MVHNFMFIASLDKRPVFGDLDSRTLDTGISTTQPQGCGVAPHPRKATFQFVPVKASRGRSDSFVANIQTVGKRVRQYIIVGYLAHLPISRPQRC